MEFLHDRVRETLKLNNMKKEITTKIIEFMNGYKFLRLFLSKKTKKLLISLQKQQELLEKTSEHFHSLRDFIFNHRQILFEKPEELELIIEKMRSLEKEIDILEEKNSKSAPEYTKKIKQSMDDSDNEYKRMHPGFYIDLFDHRENMKSITAKFEGEMQVLFTKLNILLLRVDNSQHYFSYLFGSIKEDQKNNTELQKAFSVYLESVVDYYHYSNDEHLTSSVNKYIASIAQDTLVRFSDSILTENYKIKLDCFDEKIKLAA